MVNMGFMTQPSIRLLQLYKNVIYQGPGIHRDVLRWMLESAKIKQVPPEGYYGGLIFDENGAPGGHPTR